MIQKVLIGIGGAIVLAAAVFAIVHFAAPRERIPPKPAQRGWVPVAASALRGAGHLHNVGAFGAWSLLCWDSAGNGKSVASINNLSGPSQAQQTRPRCAVALVMRNRDVKYDILNVRLQAPPSGAGVALILAYRNTSNERRAAALPGMPGLPVEVKADRDTVAFEPRCLGAMCIAVENLSSSELESILSAHSLVIRLSAAKSPKGDIVAVPTEGLKAAFAAFRRQTS